MRLIAIAAFLSACVYKIDVQQGNYITQDMVSRLKKGMSKNEVKQALGTPLLSDAFHGNRWDYYFSHVVGGKPQDRTRLSIFFEDEKLVSVMGDVRAAQAGDKTAPAAQPGAPAAAPTAPATVP